MLKRYWNACVLMGAAVAMAAGCEKPATGPGTGTPTTGAGTQAGSTTGGGAEVPMPAATPAEPTPIVTEPTPAVEPLPADPAKPADPAATTEEKKPE